MKLALKLPKKTNNIIFGNDSFEIVNIFKKNNIAYKIYSEKFVTVYFNARFILKYIKMHIDDGLETLNEMVEEKGLTTNTQLLDTLI